MHLILFCGHNKQFNVTRERGQYMGTTQACCTCDLKVYSVDLNSFRGNGALPVWGGGGVHVMEPFCMIMTTSPLFEQT
jgi:hypothetical protein